MSTARLVFQLLGPFEVHRYNEHPPIEFRSNSERALLAYLAMEAGKPHSREFLCGLIWPELSEEKARNNLRVTLSRLRKLLETTDAKPDLIATSGVSVQFNADQVTVDVSIFLGLIHQVESHIHPTPADCTYCIARFEQAANLFQGEFLRGFSPTNSAPFQEWLVVRRELIHRHAINTFHILTDYHLRRGKLEPAQTFAWRQLELEPWREEAHRQLMTCHAIREEKNAALAQYEQCKKILEDELGVEPSLETQALYERIKRSRGRKRPVLPAGSTNFVGREREQAEIIQILSEPECRLLTLIGMGGVGKTRLAAQIASQFEYTFLDGTIHVPLSVIQSPERVPDAIADALGFAFAGSNDPLEQLLNHLENKEYLIVLDNFEHVLAAVPLLVKIWERCPGIKMLVTSRERLGLEQEYLVELGGLPASLATDPAIDMLSMCIRRVKPSFNPSEHDLAGMVELCGRVEGMPLALELIAPMIRILSMQEIFNDIHTLELSSLDAVFERSWVLLSHEEQTGFMQLSVFNTSFTRQAAREVARIDLAMFASLVDKSLIQRTSSTAGVEDAQDTVNFALHPLLKQFAHQKLIREPELLEHVQESHANYFLSMVDSLDKSILGPDESLAIKKIHALYEDIFAAMKWGCGHARYESVRKGLHIHSHYFESYCAFRLGKYFFGEFVQLLRGIKHQQEKPSNALDRILARAIAYYGWYVMRSGEYQGALEHEREAVQLARESGEVCMEAGALNAIGVIHAMLGDLDLSNQFFEYALEAAKRAEGQLEARWCMTGVYQNLGDNAMTQSKLDLAEEYFDIAMEHIKGIGHYWGMLDAHLAYGRLYMQQGNYEKARISLQEGLALAERNNYLWLKNRSLVRLGDLAFKQEDWETAVRYYQESFDSIEEFGRKGLLEETRRKFEEASRLAKSR